MDNRISSRKWDTPLRKRRGASLTGYGLVVGLIAVVALSATTSIGSTVQDLFTDVGGKMDDAVQDTVSVPSPSASASAPLGYYAAISFEGSFTNTGSGSDVTINAYGSTTQISSDRATDGSQSMYIDSTDSGDNSARVEVSLPQLLNSNHWEIRLDVWQDSQVNDENYPSVAFWAYNPSMTESLQSFVAYRWGPSADTYGTYVARDSSGQVAWSNITSNIVDDDWQTLTIRYNNGMLTMFAGSTQVNSGLVDLNNYAWGNSLLVLGHTTSLAGDNGYQGYIDKVEVEIFD